MSRKLRVREIREGAAPRRGNRRRDDRGHAFYCYPVAIVLTNSGHTLGTQVALWLYEMAESKESSRLAVQNRVLLK